MANFYNVGDSVRLAATFKNIGDTPTDPSTITFKLRDPRDNVTTYVYGTDAQLVRDSTGVFHVDYTCLYDGVHRYEWIGTGIIATAEDGYFSVAQKFF